MNIVLANKNRVPFRGGVALGQFSTFPAGALAPNGALVTVLDVSPPPFQRVSGAITPTGALASTNIAVTAYSQDQVGGITPSSTLVSFKTPAFTNFTQGATTPAGGVSLFATPFTFFQFTAGAISPTAKLVSQAAGAFSQVTSGAITPTSDVQLLFGPVNTFNFNGGGITPTGDVNLAVTPFTFGKTITGQINPFGTLTSVKTGGVFSQNLKGLITPTNKRRGHSGLIITFGTGSTTKVLGGAISPGGVVGAVQITSAFAKLFSGSIAPFAGVVRTTPLITKQIGGSISPSGAFTQSTISTVNFTKSISGSITPSSQLTRNTPPVPKITSPLSGFIGKVGTPVSLDPSGTSDAEGAWVGTWTILGQGGAVRFTFTGTFGNFASHITSWTPTISEAVIVRWAVTDGGNLTTTIQISGNIQPPVTLVPTTMVLVPSQFSLNIGDSITLIASVEDQNGVVMDQYPVNWAGVTGIMSVSPAFGPKTTVLGIGAGTGLIKATT